jgi:predicted RNase H-like HicB family nuclease
MRYTIEIKWSDEDQCYVVILPEFADRHAMPVASGITYEEAAKRAVIALENVVAFHRERGTLPEPATYQAAS